jgi:hypothetical protein
MAAFLTASHMNAAATSHRQDPIEHLMKFSRVRKPVEKLFGGRITPETLVGPTTRNPLYSQAEDHKQLFGSRE